VLLRQYRDFISLFARALFINTFMKKKKIYAVVGMAGSGKSEVINYLIEKFGWPKVYFGEITFDEMKKRGLELNYVNERITREDLRKKGGMGCYAKLSLPKIKKALAASDVVLIESLYSWSEYKIIKTKYAKMFKVIAVHASPDIRFKRLAKRKNWRPIKDAKTFKTRDWTEIENIEKGGPIAIADYMIINEGTRKELEKSVDDIIKKEKK
jgi:dephospho-CoA kinase